MNQGHPAITVNWKRYNNTAEKTLNAKFIFCQFRNYLIQVIDTGLTRLL